MAINYTSTLDKTYADANQSYQGVYAFAEREIEVQRNNNFEFVFVDNFNSANSSGENHAEVIRLSVNKSFIPHFSQDPLTVKRGNSEIKFAGVPKFGNGQITCIDYIGMDTLMALRAWQSKSYNVQTEKVGLVQDYKKNCQLYEYTPDGQTVRRFNLYGCWISSLDEEDLDHESNQIHRINVRIEYDKAIESSPNEFGSV